MLKMIVYARNIDKGLNLQKYVEVENLEYYVNAGSFAKAEVRNSN